MSFLCRHVPHRSFSVLVWLAAASLFSGCENSATSMLVDGKDHALVLMREQPYFWKDEIRQYIVISRLPDCQRRVQIHSDKEKMVPVAVYEAGDLLWAFYQGGRWYLASTRECRVQDWNNVGGQPPGPAAGSFGQRDGEIVFIPAPKPSAPGA